MMFKVIDFSKGSKKIILSHSRIFEDARETAAPASAPKKKSSGNSNSQNVQNTQNEATTTLGDISGLEELKARMVADEKKK